MGVVGMLAVEKVTEVGNSRLQRNLTSYSNHYIFFFNKTFIQFIADVFRRRRLWRRESRRRKLWGL